MNKNEYLRKILESTLSEESKEKIKKILEKDELTFETIEQIKDIIQNSIDNIPVTLTKEDEEELQRIEEKFIQDIDRVENELCEDMKYVEDELTDLDDMVKHVQGVVDQQEIEAIKQSI